MIPAAVAAVIAATIRDHPAAEPETTARRAVEALRADGWTITAPDAKNAAQTAV